jgi:predicted RNase H-like nuclease
VPESVVGIDGVRGGWVAVELADGKFASLAFERQLADLARRYPTAAVLAADIPIGLPGDVTGDGGRREADAAAREYLGPNAGRVFATPSRRHLEALREGSTYSTARPQWVSAGLGAVSAQSFQLGTKILEADALRETEPRLREIHPEVSFQAMNDGQHLRFAKKTWNGFVERWALLEAVDLLVPIGTAELGPSAVDDVLDAAAAAWSAERIRQRLGKSLPAVPPLARNGQPLAIWY